MTTPDKVLITNIGALRAKYGRDGVDRIRVGLDRLIAADATRGLRTRIVALDDGRTARALGISAVSDHADAEATKVAFDAIDEVWSPAYFVIVGSDDVIASQPMRNPLYQAGPDSVDDDLIVASDLPYACDHDYSTSIGHFRGPSRVVGRIPDGHASTSTAQLRTALKVAATYRSRPRTAYEKIWALTAADWRRSSVELLTKTVGSTTGLVEIPPHLRWQVRHTQRALHFFNCHGASNRPQMQGQRGSWRPVVMNPKELLQGERLREGTVVATECCYTGAMVPPDRKSGPAFVDVYTRKGAYAFLGSSTEVWGGIHSNEDADLLVRFYLHHVLSGTSSGRALLQARQDYILRKTALSPTDLKTLAQFTLFGDPSLHPVVPDRAVINPDIGPTRGLVARRRRLKANGQALHASTEHAGDVELEATEADHDALRAAVAGQISHRFSAKARSVRFPIVAPGGAQVDRARHFAAVHETTDRGTHMAMTQLEDGVISELRLLQRR